MPSFVQDLRYALRMLLKSPGFAFLARYIPARRATGVDPLAALREE